MADVLSITGTIFFVIAVGFFCAQRKIVSREGLQTFGKYVVNIALPALIFSSLCRRNVNEVIDLGYMAAFLFGSLTVLIVGYFWSRYVWRENRVASTFDAAGMTCANSGFFGYPILLMALPEIAPTAFAYNVILDNLIIIPLVMILAERASSTGRGWGLVWTICRRVGTSPIVLAMAAGLIVSYAGIPLPIFMVSAVDLFAASSAAISLFVIGGALVGIRLSSIGRRVFGIVLGKLVLLPAAVWLALIVMEIVGFGVQNRDLFNAAIVLASTPAMAIYPILAMQYGEEESAGAAMLVMTLLSFFSISAILLLVVV